MDLVQAIVLGIIQGVAEWLPISSEGMTSLVLINGFGQTLASSLVIALWLHLGTMAAAIIYFWKDIKQLWSALPAFFRQERSEDVSLLWFLLIATGVSLALGGFFYFFVVDKLQISGVWANAIIGVLLLITGIVQLTKRVHQKNKQSLQVMDSVLSGLGQGVAVFPGISRSGTTTAILLFRKFSGEQALRLSFLMSIPVTFVTIIVLAMSGGQVLFSFASLVALLCSFIIGFLTMKYFIRLAKRVSFGYFALIFGVLVLLASLVAYFI